MQFGKDCLQINFDLKDKQYKLLQHVFNRFYCSLERRLKVVPSQHSERTMASIVWRPRLLSSERDIQVVPSSDMKFKQCKTKGQNAHLKKPVQINKYI